MSHDGAKRQVLEASEIPLGGEKAPMSDSPSEGESPDKIPSRSRECGYPKGKEVKCLKVNPPTTEVPNKRQTKQLPEKRNETCDCNPLGAWETDLPRAIQRVWSQVNKPDTPLTLSVLFDIQLSVPHGCPLESHL